MEKVSQGRGIAQGDESDPVIQQKEHLLVRWKMRSDCFACQGFRQGQVRSKSRKRRPLGEVDGNARRRQTDYVIGVACVRFLVVTTEIAGSFIIIGIK
ncbi:D-amino-acid oxidase [Fusarium oxysporum f. sp. albedinis]|nr:D-amino-acid oxidase [Fusarium oxysporum f. sp. albedinis]